MIYLNIILGGAGWGSDNINEFDTETLEWKEIGKLSMRRMHHAADLVEINDQFIEENCQ